MKLEQIKNLMSDTRQRLAGLTAESGNIDEIAKARLLEREKLRLFNEQEAAETQRLEAERIADRDKMRTTLAKKFRRNAERDLAEDNRLTAEAMTALRTCIAALVERHKLWAPGALGLMSDEAQASFTPGEHRELVTALANSHQPIRIAEFTAAAKEALADARPDAQDEIGRLFAPPPHMLGMGRAEPPTARKSVPMIDTAQALHGTTFPAPVEADTPDVVDDEPVTGAYFVVDLRPPANRGEGPRTTHEATEKRNVERGPTRCINGDVTRSPRH